MKLTRTDLMIIALLLPFLKPAYLEYVPGITSIYSLAKYASLAILGMMLLFGMIKNKKALSRFSVVILILNAFPVVRMLQEGMMNGEPIKHLIDLVGFVLIFEVFRDKWNSLLKSIMVAFELLIYTNLITIVLFPNGLYHAGLYWDNWFLGYSNSEIKYLLIGSVTAMLYGYFTGRWYRSYALITACIVTAIRLGAVTGIIGMIMIFIFYFMQNRRSVKLFNLKSFSIVAACGFVYFIVQQNAMQYTDIVERYTGKTVTFTSRFSIWETSIEMWTKQPWTGYGWKTAAQRGVEYMNIYGTNAHNTYLEYMYLGGIVALALFVMVIYMIHGSMKKYEHKNVVQMMYSFLSAFLLMMLAEAYVLPVVQLLYLLLFAAGENLGRLFENEAEVKPQKIKRRRITW